MVEWRPLIGALPPLSETEWHRVFTLYQATPEYLHENSWMGLSDFQRIFFWEWLHRFLGRLIGLCYGLPLAYFWLRNRIPEGFKPALLGLLFLGGAQGYMGWYMVQSGLVDQPNVSHYRLAAHLALAFTIFACLIKAALAIRQPVNIPQITLRPLRIHVWALAFAYGFTVFWGAYTAGLDAGLLYNDSFPKMGGQWIPFDFNLYQPWFVNVFENHSAVQFTHRWLAITTWLIAMSLSLHAWKRGALNPFIIALSIGFTLQACLGIATLMSHVQTHIAATHQMGALLLLGLIVVTLHQNTKQPAQ